MLKALFRETRPGCWEGLLYADDFTLFESLVSMKGKPEACKRALESKEFKMIVKESQMMISSENIRKVAE